MGTILEGIDRSLMELVPHSHVLRPGTVPGDRRVQREISYSIRTISYSEETSLMPKGNPLRSRLACRTRPEALGEVSPPFQSLVDAFKRAGAE